MKKRKNTHKNLPEEFWQVSNQELLKTLDVNKTEGLTDSEANLRLQQYGENVLKAKKKFKVLRLLLSQFNTPFIYLLLVAICLSFFLYDITDALIILGIIVVSAILSFIQEKSALQSIEQLQK